jgi:ATP-dependent helicase/nuclease subunit A
LLKKGYIAKQAAEKINISSILKFFNSDLGRLVKDSKNSIMREWPFTYAAPAAELYPDLKNCAEEKVIIQGIVDMLVKTPDKIVIIDFKTDRITPAQVKQRAERYLPQLKWYCKAADEIFESRNTAGYLYFLSAGKIVEVC